MKKTNANRSRSSGPALDPKLIVFGVIIALVAVLVIRKKSQPEPQKLAAQVEKKVAVSNDPVILAGNEPVQNNAAFAKEMLAGRREVAARTTLGLKTVELKSTNGKLLIPFEFVPHKVWCQGGDIDTMKYASSSRTNKEFYISLESMGDSSVREGLRVSVNDLYKGVNHVFKIDSSSSTKSLALRICADKKKNGSCSKAKVIDQTTLNETMESSGKKPQQDYVFYFQHLILTKGKLQIYRSDLFTEKFKKSVSQYLMQEKVNSDDLQLAFKTTKTIRSNPPDIVNGKITLTLPYNDPRCLAGN